MMISQPKGEITPADDSNNSTHQLGRMEGTLGGANGGERITPLSKARFPSQTDHARVRFEAPGATAGGVIKPHAEDIAGGRTLHIGVTRDGNAPEFVFEVKN